MSVETAAVDAPLLAHDGLAERRRTSTSSNELVMSLLAVGGTRRRGFAHGVAATSAHASLRSCLPGVAHAPSRIFGSAQLARRARQRFVALRRHARRASACRAPSAARPAGRASGWQLRCAANSASRITSSATLFAPPSTMTIASRLHGDDQVRCRSLELLERRVDDELAVDAADADGRERPVERNVGQL